MRENNPPFHGRPKDFGIFKPVPRNDAYDITLLNAHFPEPVYQTIDPFIKPFECDPFPAAHKGFTVREKNGIPVEDICEGPYVVTT